MSVAVASKTASSKTACRARWPVVESRPAMVALRIAMESGKKQDGKSVNSDEKAQGFEGNITVISLPDATSSRESPSGTAAKETKVVDGIIVGTFDGTVLGSRLGTELGRELGELLGLRLGIELGTRLGLVLGSELGDKLGGKLGAPLGSSLGAELGISLGERLGF